MELKSRCATWSLLSLAALLVSFVPINTAVEFHDEVEESSPTGFNCRVSVDVDSLVQANGSEPSGTPNTSSPMVRFYNCTPPELGRNCSSTADRNWKREWSRMDCDLDEEGTRAKCRLAYFLRLPRGERCPPDNLFHCYARVICPPKRLVKKARPSILHMPTGGKSGNGDIGIAVGEGVEGIIDSVNGMEGKSTLDNDTDGSYTELDATREDSSQPTHVTTSRHQSHPAKTLIIALLAATILALLCALLCCCLLSKRCGLRANTHEVRKLEKRLVSRNGSLVGGRSLSTSDSNGVVLNIQPYRNVPWGG